MRKVLCFALLFVSALLAKAQPLTQTYIDSLVKVYNNHIPSVHHYEYFLPYSGFYEAKDSLKLNRKLKSKTAKDLLRVMLMHPIANTEEALGVEDFSKGFITIELKSRQSKQQKREALAEAREVFAIEAEKPMVRPNEANATLAKIKFEELDAITRYYRPLSAAIYGQQGANGMIQVWIRPLKK
ncbi:hypothetical protein [Pedobacter sp. ASV12]|uniref:hypothetical protein n=1 Tax=Pedobacter sp. ASV12 TaxID=2795120 RepID=UPI0018EAFA00|nr:hypothetical protein [Pedobacter sp. ASV12]